MSWFCVKHSGAYALILSLVLSACAYEPTTPESFGAPKITTFETDFASITRGVGIGGDDIVGTVTLRWEIDGARAIWLSANGDDIDLSQCVPLAGEPNCNSGGTITVEPELATTYRLEAANGKDQCRLDPDSGEPTSPDRCTTRQIEVTVVVPATASLGSPGGDIVSGQLITIPYEVAGANEWQLGRIYFNAGSTGVEACLAESLVRQDDGPFCMLPEDDSESDPPSLSTEGDVTIYAARESFTLVVLASNGAEDGLGDLEMGDVSVAVSVLGAPDLNALEVVDETVAPGGILQIEWSASDGQSIELTFEPDSVVDTESLNACESSDASVGWGRCDFRVERAADLGTVVVTGLVTGVADSKSAPVQDSFEIGSVPTVTFTSEPAVLLEGEAEVTLSWTASDANSIFIEDNKDPPTVIWSTEDCPECSLTSGQIEIEDADGGAQWTLTASNLFGKSQALAGAEARDAPAILEIQVDGVTIDEGVLLSKGDADLSWECENTLLTTLEWHTISTDSAEECSSVASGWHDSPGFSGDPSGTYSFTGLSDAVCVRFTAIGASNQSKSRVFSVSRSAAIDSFEVSDDSIVAGSTVRLDWESRFVFTRQFFATPSGAVNANDLVLCSESDEATTDEHCDVTIPVGTTGPVSITFEAYGFGQETPTTSDVSLSVGLGPSIASFEPEPRVLAETGTVELSWAVDNADTLRIYDPDRAEIYETNNLAEIESGSFDVNDVSATTTWTLVVSSGFGEDSAQATAFHGPWISGLLIGTVDDPDRNAMDGDATIFPSIAPIEWIANNATASLIESTTLGGEESCADVDTSAYGEVESFNHGAGETVFSSLGVVDQNLCVRVTVSAGDASSEIIVLVREIPDIVGISTSPDCIDLSQIDAKVDIDMTVRDATELVLSAEILHKSDGLRFFSQTVCTDSDGMTGDLTGNWDVEDSVSCQHSVRRLLEQCESCVTSGGDDGGGTGVIITPIDWTDTEIRYTLRVSDEEGDVTDADTEDIGENVKVVRSGTIGGMGDGTGCDDGG